MHFAYGIVVTLVTVVVQGKVRIEVVNPDPSVAVACTVVGGKVTVVFNVTISGRPGLLVLKRFVVVHKSCAIVA
jgi:hypothetical protein